MDNLFEYRRDLDALHFTPAQKADLAARAAQAAAQPRTAHRPVRRTLVLAAAVALVLALGIGAGATVLHLASSAFAPLFGTAQTEIIDKIGRPIDASCTDNGVTVTADAIIGDKYNAYIIYSVTQADGTPLELPEGVESILFDKYSTDLLRSSGGGSEWSIIDPETGVHQYVESISGQGALKRGNATAEFQDLQYYDPATKKCVLLAEGSWTLQFKVDYQDSSVKLPAGQTFTWDGIDFTITEVSISPLAVQIQYQTDDSFPMDAALDGETQEEQARLHHACLVGNIPLILTKADGSILDTTERSGGGFSSGGRVAKCHKSAQFDNILPLEDVVSITFGDVVIPVNLP